MISTDFPQNLFFHLWSEDRQKQAERQVCLHSHKNRCIHSSSLWIRTLPCQNVKFSDSAWQAEMGGWWLTWKCNTEHHWGVLCLYWGFVSIFLYSLLLTAYLLTDVVKPSVFSVTLVGFSQNRVEWFVAIPPGRPGISRDGEHCHINLGPSFLINEPGTELNCISTPTGVCVFYRAGTKSFTEIHWFEKNMRRSLAAAHNKVEKTALSQDNSPNKLRTKPHPGSFKVREYYKQRFKNT